MAITIADLLIFNNVESTDIIQGVTKLPYFKPVAYMPNVTYVNGFEEYIKGQSGRGSQVIKRNLNKGTADVVKVNTADAFKFNHVETPDSITVIPIDDLIKKSELILEPVEVARQSATGAKKVEIVANVMVEASQKLISGYLIAATNKLADETVTTSANIKDRIIDAMTLNLDVRPNVLMVSRSIYAELLKLTTTGDFIPAVHFDTIKTGVVGKILGLDVFIDLDFPAEVEFALYANEYFSVFPLFDSLDIVPAQDYKGSYARGLMVQGGDKTKVTLGNGAWGVHKVKEIIGG